MYAKSIRAAVAHVLEAAAHPPPFPAAPLRACSQVSVYVIYRDKNSAEPSTHMAPRGAWACPAREGPSQGPDDEGEREKTMQHGGAGNKEKDTDREGSPESRAPRRGKNFQGQRGKAHTPHEVAQCNLDTHLWPWWRGAARAAPGYRGPRTAVSSPLHECDIRRRHPARPRPGPAQSDYYRNRFHKASSAAAARSTARTASSSSSARRDGWR